MEEELNYIKTFQEEYEPDSHNFVNEYFEIFKSNFENNELPKEIRFLDEQGFRISAPTTNKTYLTVFFSKPEKPSYLGKFSLVSDGADIKKESVILKSLKDLDVSPELLYYGELQNGSDVNFLFTTVEGVNNNLNGTNPDFWWANHKEILLERLLLLHKLKNNISVSRYEDIFISDFFENVLFEEENLFDFVFQSDSDPAFYDFILKCKDSCLDICSKLDKKEFVLCHNNLCKSSVLFEPNSKEKFKFINFHKSIIAPPAIDLLSIYHRLSLEEDDYHSSFSRDSFSEIKKVYEKIAGVEIDFSVDIRFLNTVQRILLLIYENNFPPVALFQSNALLKFRSRSSELKYLKDRFLNIIQSPEFSHKKQFEYIQNADDIPLQELLLYG
jgi:hypothetical protein